ncbi:Pentatricopeptide repeat-containing protein [Forsythia ovata]|uniref:Pentatricopeptide repeat-containing protein n=1 Tax=Forsythia ovata TaxID=205694 RepID=A0ABD1RYL3_9LAMI
MLKPATLFHASLQPHLPPDFHHHHPLSQTSNAKEVTQLHAQHIFTSTILSNNIEKPVKKTLFSYNTIIKRFLQNHLSQDALMVFVKLLCCPGLLPDEFTLPCAIKACANLGAVREGKMIHGLAFKLGFGSGSGVHVESSLVRLYSKCGDINSARKLFDKMIVKDLVSWNVLLDGYVKCGGENIEVVLRLFDEMPEKDVFTWTVLIDGLAKSGRVEEAREVFDSMLDKNVASWNAMINGYMKSGYYKLARDLFDVMGARNIITWNSMISGYELNGKFIEALRLYPMMLDEGLDANAVTIVTLLSAISKLASLSKGRWVHSYMAKTGYRLDGVLGISLIEMYSKCGSIESALMVFRGISKKKLGHWTAIIVGLGMHGMAPDAIELFLEMRRNGVKPNAITFVGVLNACSHVGLVDDGRRYFYMMTNEYGIEPTVEHYGCLVDILCRAGHLDEAKSTIIKMPMKPSKIIWMTLLSSARNHRNIDIGEYAAKNLIELAPETVQCYVLLSNMYAVAGQWRKVSLVRETMKRRGFKKEPGCSSIEHKGVLHEFMVGDKSHPQSELIYSKLSEMKDKLRLVGHVPDTTRVLLFVEGEKEKQAELENHSERLAIAFGLINVDRKSHIRIVKNLRVCNDCHSVIKFLSKIYEREIIVRDNTRFHHFKNGSCSCKDYW